jgi:hypothetical protein
MWGFTEFLLLLYPYKQLTKSISEVERIEDKVHGLRGRTIEEHTEL